MLKWGSLLHREASILVLTSLLKAPCSSPTNFMVYGGREQPFPTKMLPRTDWDLCHKVDFASLFLRALSFLVWVSPSWKWPATWSCRMVGRAGSSCARDTCPPSSLLVSGVSGEAAALSFYGKGGQ